MHASFSVALLVTSFAFMYDEWRTGRWSGVVPLAFSIIFLGWLALLLRRRKIKGSKIHLANACEDAEKEDGSAEMQEKLHVALRGVRARSTSGDGETKVIDILDTCSTTVGCAGANTAPFQVRDTSDAGNGMGRDFRLIFTPTRYHLFSPSPLR